MPCCCLRSADATALLEVQTGTVWTDHKAYKWHLTISDAFAKLARWTLWLSENEFNIVHRARIKLQAADALSELPTDGCDKTKLIDDIPPREIATKVSTTDETELEQKKTWKDYKDPIKLEFIPYLP